MILQSRKWVANVTFAMMNTMVQIRIMTADCFGNDGAGVDVGIGARCIDESIGALRSAGLSARLIAPAFVQEQIRHLPSDRIEQITDVSPHMMQFFQQLDSIAVNCKKKKIRPRS